MSKRRITSVQAALLDALWEFGAQLNHGGGWVPNAIAYVLCQFFFYRTPRVHQILLDIPERFLAYDPQRRAFKVLRLPREEEVITIRDESGQAVRGLELPEHAFDKLRANLDAGVPPEELDTQHLLHWPKEIAASQRLKKAPASDEAAVTEPPAPPPSAPVLPRPTKKRRPPPRQQEVLRGQAQRERIFRILRCLIRFHDRGVELISPGLASSFCREVDPNIDVEGILNLCVRQGLLTQSDNKWRVTVAGRLFHP